MGLLGLKFNSSGLSPVVKLNNFFLRNFMYLNYIFVGCSNGGVIGIDGGVAVGADGGGDVSSIIVPDGGSKDGALGNT